MRQDTTFDSLKKIAAHEPSLWSGIQKAVNKFNENNVGKKNMSMFDVFSNQGKELVHINPQEDAMLGDVPDQKVRGRHGDDRMAALTPRQIAFLKAWGGAGTTNPRTGKREFYLGGDPGGYGDYGAGDNGGGGSPYDLANDMPPGTIGARGSDNPGGVDYTPPGLGQGPYAGRPNTSYGPAPASTGPSVSEAPPAPGESPYDLANDVSPSPIASAMREARDRIDREVRALRTQRSKQSQVLGTFLGLGGRALGKLGTTISERNANTRYGKNFNELSDDEYSDLINYQSPDLRGNPDSTGDMPLAAMTTPPQATLPPVPAAVGKPDYWNLEGTPMQQRTGAATEALYGQSIYGSPDAQAYWKQLARESINPMNPPADIDYQYLMQVLGKERPNTVEAFLSALS